MSNAAPHIVAERRNQFMRNALGLVEALFPWLECPFHRSGSSSKSSIYLVGPSEDEVKRYARVFWADPVKGGPRWKRNRRRRDWCQAVHYFHVNKHAKLGEIVADYRSKEPDLPFILWPPDAGLNRACLEQMDIWPKEILEHCSPELLLAALLGGPDEEQLGLLICDDGPLRELADSRMRRLLLDVVARDRWGSAVAESLRSVGAGRFPMERWPLQSGRREFMSWHRKDGPIVAGAVSLCPFMSWRFQPPNGEPLNMLWYSHSPPLERWTRLPLGVHLRLEDIVEDAGIFSCSGSLRSLVEIAASRRARTEDDFLTPHSVLYERNDWTAHVVKDPLHPPTMHCAERHGFPVLKLSDVCHVRECAPAPPAPSEARLWVALRGEQFGCVFTEIPEGDGERMSWLAELSGLEDRDFLLYVLRSEEFYLQMRSRSYGTFAEPVLNVTLLGESPIGWPYAETRARLVAALKKQSHGLADMIIGEDYFTELEHQIQRIESVDRPHYHRGEYPSPYDPEAVGYWARAIIDFFQQCLGGPAESVPLARVAPVARMKHYVDTAMEEKRQTALFKYAEMLTRWDALCMVTLLRRAPTRDENIGKILDGPGRISWGKWRELQRSARCALRRVTDEPFILSHLDIVDPLLEVSERRVESITQRLIEVRNETDGHGMIPVSDAGPLLAEITTLTDRLEQELASVCRLNLLFVERNERVPGNERVPEGNEVLLRNLTGAAEGFPLITHQWSSPDSIYSTFVKSRLFLGSIQRQAFVPAEPWMSFRENPDDPRGGIALWLYDGLEHGKRCYRSPYRDGTMKLSIEDHPVTGSFVPFLR